MPSTFSSLHVHIIFSTKNRYPFITQEICTRLHPYLGGVCRKVDCECVAVGGMPDHVHLLVRLHPQTSVADLVRVVKANSSKRVHETFTVARRFAWQTGYAAFAVSRSNVDAVVRYIANQETHHREISFDEELRAFLVRHGVEVE